MPINPRYTALTSAVIVFFIAVAVGSCCQNSPFTCCKRAATAMLAAYLVVAITVRVVNAIIVDAMVSKQVNKIMDKIKGTARSNARAD